MLSPVRFAWLLTFYWKGGHTLDHTGSIFRRKPLTRRANLLSVPDGPCKCRGRPPRWQNPTREVSAILVLPQVSSSGFMRWYEDYDEALGFTNFKGRSHNIPNGDGQGRECTTRCIKKLEQRKFLLLFFFSGDLASQLRSWVRSPSWLQGSNMRCRGRRI